jgi:signal-transduction protein with cAMP-binding, CBS, and nucleotidyltransferase domain
VHGDAALAAALRDEATEIARATPEFQRRLAASQEDFKPPLGLFGGFVKREGRVDLKLGGLLPLVAGARVLALKAGARVTSTRERLAAIADGTRLKPADIAVLEEAQEIVTRAILDQQIADLERGQEPSVRVDPGRWTEMRADRVKQSLRRIAEIPMLVRDALSAGG